MCGNERICLNEYLRDVTREASSGKDGTGSVVEATCM